MGFPVGYTELFIPTLFLHTLTFLTIIRKLLFTLFSSLGLPDFLESIPNPNPTSTPPDLVPHHRNMLHFTTPARPPLSAVLTRELLPLVRVSDVEERENDQHHDYCAVCLYEVRGDEVIRWLDNCKHVFHSECLDRWMDLDHRTCPLCRTPFLRDHLLREFNQRLLSADLHHRFFSDDFCCHDHLVPYVDDHYIYTPTRLGHNSMALG